jgi:peptidyl-prolyl cis-trans isomerase D
MFDLFRRKDTNLRIVLGVLLGLVALSMVVTLIPGFGSNGFGAGPGSETVAQVCGEPVTAQEVRLKVQQMLNRQSLPPESAAIFIPQFVDQYVAVKGVACYANETGLVASDKDVATKIQKDVPALWQDGKFVGRQMYEMMLKQTGLTIAQFEDSMKKDIETQRLRTLMLMSAVATPKEVEDAFRDTEEKIKLDYVVLDPVEVGRNVQIPDAELLAEYEKNKASYRTPEARNVKLYVLDGGAIQASMQVTETELRRLYSENQDNFRSPEQSKVRHILFGTKDKPEAEDAKMRALAESVYKQLKAGAKFEDMVNKYSDDKGSKSNGGSVGFITRGQTVKNFDEYSFTGPLNTLSNPIKTEFGYHLIDVQERKPAGMRSFEEVRGALEADLRQSKKSDGLVKAADQLRAELIKAPTQVPSIAQQYGLTPVQFEYSSESTSVPGIGPKPELFALVKQLKKGEVSEVSTLGPERVAVILVDGVTPSRQSTFEEAKMAILGTKLVAARNKLVEDRKQQGINLMKNGGNLEAIAKDLGLTIKQTQEFNRQGFADGIGPASAVIDAFTRTPGQLSGPSTVDGKWFFVKLVDKKAADMSLLPARRAEIVNIVKNRKASERADIFEETLVKHLVNDGKIKISEDVKKRIAAGYGG